MDIILVGVSHKTADINFREKVAFKKSDFTKGYEKLKQINGILEVVIISTCNRSEIFSVVENKNEGIKELKRFYMEFFKIDKSSIEKNCFEMTNKEVVKYLFESCCGLHSLVLGEDQILGQVKESLERAANEEGRGKVLDRMFLQAITTAKKMKTKTRISNNPLSISSIAVKKIEELIGTLENKKIMLLGTGEMGRLVLNPLIERNIEKIYVCARNIEIASRSFGKNDCITYVPFKRRYEVLEEIDGIISSTAAPHYVLKNTDFYNSISDKKICIIDIALPRDVEPKIEEIPGVKLIDIDSLKEVANENLKEREEKVEIIKKGINKDVEEFKKWLLCLPIHPKIKEIRDYSLSIAEEGLVELFKKLDHIDKKDKETIERNYYYIINKIWQKPINQLKYFGEKGQGREMASFVDELFGFNCIK